MNAKLAKHLRRIARAAVPEEGRQYVAVPRSKLQPGATLAWAGLTVVEYDPVVTYVNDPGTQRAVYRALKREARRRPVQHVKRWRLRDNDVARPS